MNESIQFFKSTEHQVLALVLPEHEIVVKLSLSPAGFDFSLREQMLSVREVQENLIETTREDFEMLLEQNSKAIEKYEAVFDIIDKLINE